MMRLIMYVVLYGIALYYVEKLEAAVYKPTFAKLRDSGMIHQISERDIQKKYCKTSAGTIAYYETSGNSVPVILIHGNSCSKEYMIKQLDGLGGTYKMIALDLPGHGDSDNALHPSTNYTLTGYAQVVAEVIQKLSLDRVILVGWSLGGHIAFELMAYAPELLYGVLVTSSAPVTLSKEGIASAYLATYSTPLGSKLEQFTADDVRAYITQGAINFDRYPLLMAASMRAHGLARYTMVNAVMCGEGVDEKKVAETSSIPLGIIMGVHEHAINNDYVRSLQYANCIMMETLDGGHDCQWSHPEEFNNLIGLFIQRVEQRCLYQSNLM